MATTFNVVGNKGLLVGGFNGRALDYMWRLEIQVRPDMQLEWEPLSKAFKPVGANFVQKRYGHSSVVVDNYIYLFGGGVEVSPQV